MVIIKEKYLIVNADDFGIDEEINRGIAECFRDGIVRSVSIVSNGLAFEDALNLVKKNTDIGIGVHLCLVGERSILPKEKIPSIVDDKSFLSKNYRHFLYKICSNKVNLLEVKDELEAQMKKVLDTGIMPTHLDSHQYTHLIPPIFNIVIQLAKKFNIKWMRYPKENKYNKNIRFISVGNCIKKLYLAFFSGYQLNALQDNNLYYADFSYGIMGKGYLNSHILKGVLEHLNSGLTDITCHPGYNPLNKKYAIWRYNWEAEKIVLESQDIKDLIKKLNIKLINYAK